MKKSKHPLVLRLCAVWMAALVAVGCTPTDKKPQQPAVSVTLTEERPMPIPNQQGRGEPIEDLVPQYAEEYLADPLLKESVIAFRRWEWNKVYSQLDTVVTEHPEHLDAYRLQAEVYLITRLHSRSWTRSCGKISQTFTLWGSVASSCICWAIRKGKQNGWML